MAVIALLIGIKLQSKADTKDTLKNIKLRNQVRAAVFRVKNVKTLLLIKALIDREEPDGTSGQDIPPGAPLSK